ncbi:MAG TPA: DNA replication/repair protein RecF [Acidimicrobiales bacterium]|nr:DNA replication/repair protein RecF [Acidimicrobiales bacterium]
MRVDRLWVTDFRSWAAAELRFAPGLTAIVGANGQGKTNLVEAIGYLATLSSFRGAPTDALVRVGAERAVVRAEVDRDDRSLLVEAEIVPGGRNRVQVNRQRLARSRDLLGALRVSVFSPDDLELVKGGPAGRRRYLDDALVASHPRHDRTRADVDRVLRQRNALLRQAGGRLTADVAATLDVWDARLAAAGEALADARAELVASLAPAVTRAYAALAEPGGASGRVEAMLAYAPAWRPGGLGAALAAARADELRRGVSLVGPHRDDVELDIGGLPARTHASQGEQRSLAFALRIAAHAVVTEVVGTPPVLVLDDVFSELDPERSAALVRELPAGQTVLTTAGVLPTGTEPELVLRLADGRVLE